MTRNFARPFAAEKLLVIILTVATTNLVFAQSPEPAWHKLVKESEGGLASDIVAIKGKLLMYCNGEVFGSSDQGSSWSFLFSAYPLLLKGYYINYYFGEDKKIQVSGDSVLIGEKLSTDGGVTWTTVTMNQATLPTYYFAPTVFQFRGRNIYMGSFYNGIVVSSDFGQTFTTLNNDYPSYYGFLDAAHVIEFYKDRPVVSTITGIYSYKNGAWVSHATAGIPTTTINSGVAKLIQGIDFLNDTWIASTNFGVYKSVDEGESWQKLDLPDLPAIKPWTLFSKPAIYYAVDVIGTNIYACFENNFYVSSDEGATWNHSAIPGSGDIYRVYAEPGYLLAMTFNGVYKSTDNGASWIQSNKGFERMTYNGFRKNGNDGFVARNLGGILRTTDQGKTWNLTDNPSPNRFTVMHGVQGQSAIVSTYKYYQYQGIMQSSVSDLYKVNTTSMQWSASAIWPVDRPWSFASSGSKYAMAGTLDNTYQKGVQFSPDGGNNWKQIFSGVTHNGFTEDEVTALVYDKDTLYAGTSLSGVYRSADDGNSWESISSVAQGWRLVTSNAELLAGNVISTVTQVMKSKNHIYVITGTDRGATPLYHSADNGTTWKETDLSDVKPGNITTIRSIGLADDGRIFMALLHSNDASNDYSSSMSMSSDQGATWNSFGQVFPQPFLSEFELIGNYIYATGATGLWRLPFKESEPAGVDVVTGLKEKRSLICYPSPFNNAFFIEYYSEIGADVEIEMKDITGRRVDLIRRQSVKGTNHVSWDDVSAISPGIYIIDLRSNGQSSRMKVMKR